MSKSTHPLLRAAEEELRVVLAEKDDLDKRKAKVDKQAIAVARAVDELRQVYGDPSAPSEAALLEDRGGITDHIRETLRKNSSLWMQPTIVRNHLLAAKVPLEYSNPMAVIHQILKRLEAKGEIESQVDDGKIMYLWKSEKK